MFGFKKKSEYEKYWYFVVICDIVTKTEIGTYYCILSQRGYGKKSSINLRYHLENYVEKGFFIPLTESSASIISPHAIKKITANIEDYVTDNYDDALEYIKNYKEKVNSKEASSKEN